MKSTSQDNSNSRRISVIRVIFVAILLVLSFFLIKAFLDVERPNDLGARLKYLARKSEGCALFVCYNNPSTKYYFSTSMGEKELQEYFRGLVYVPKSGAQGQKLYEDAYLNGYDELVYESRDSKNIVSLKFYQNREAVPAELKQRLKNDHLVEMADYNYKDFLKHY